MRRRRLLVGMGVGVVLALGAAVPASGSGLGVQSFAVSATERPTPEQEARHEPGAPDVRAGSHPYVFTTSFVMNEPEVKNVKGNLTTFEPEGLKDVWVALPPGFVGDPSAVPTCSYQRFLENQCPDDTAVGMVTVGLVEGTGYKSVSRGILAQLNTVTNALYNVEPPGGVPVELGVMVAKTHPVLLDASVRTGGDYGVTVSSSNITEGLAVMTVRVTVWGVPADPAHDRLRGKCLSEANSYRGEEEEGAPHDEEESQRETEEKAGVKEPVTPASCPANIPVRPFLTSPVSCGAPLGFGLGVDGWNRPGNFATGEHVISRTAVLPTFSGCERLPFSPTIGVQPDGGAGSTPTGLNVDLRVPQEATSNPVGLGEADIKTTTVKLPVGVQVSPAASDGLEACSGDPADQPGTPGNEIGLTGFKELDPVSEPGVLTPQFTSTLPGSVDAALAGETEPLRPGVNFCPDASKIANVHIKTPLLEGEVTGSVYLAAPQNFKTTGGPLENPFGSLLAMYLVASEPVTGVVVKLPGRITLCQNTGELVEGQFCEAEGQIVTTFEHTPQLPYSEAKLEFYGTDRAPLTTPALCGTYNTESTLAPWSGAPAAHPVASFQVDSGPNGAPCSDPLPFAPSLSSGTTNINAGSFSNLTTTLSREDGQQQIQQVTLRYPPGLSGILTGVSLCPEAQANAGTCSSASQIGEALVSVGLGNDPYTVTGGKVYLTEKYGNAPFGLSIVTTPKAGPFVLQEGRPVVVRAKIEINPVTAALTVTTGAPGTPYSIPSMIEGIPLQIKHVNVLINRPGFTFNPTSCDPAKVEGSVQSAERASSQVSIPFQVANCGNLKFEPKVSISTQGKTSKADGASLTYKLAYPDVPVGTDANIHYVKVELPKRLPSRLTTLQKACTQAQFQANSAGCPGPSVIGYAKASVPNIPVALEGPVYFVSNGGEAFPNLVMVLQGYGVTIDLVGDTFISKSGITSTTFKLVPDNPLNTFEITLPEGPYSALAANGDLCSLTKTVTVKKKVTVRVKGRKKTETRKVKRTEAESLVMPSEFVAQNGVVLKQATAITVTGCAATKAKKAAKKTSGGAAGKHKRAHRATEGKRRASR